MPAKKKSTKAKKPAKAAKAAKPKKGFPWPKLPAIVPAARVEEFTKAGIPPKNMPDTLKGIYELKAAKLLKEAAEDGVPAPIIVDLLIGKAFTLCVATKKQKATMLKFIEGWLQEGAKIDPSEVPGFIPW